MLKLFRLIKPYKGYVAIVLVLALAQSIGTLLLPRLMSDIVDKGIVKGDQRAILETGGLMLLMSIVATACAICGSFFASKVATGFGKILRGAIFARVEHFSIHQFDRFGSASLVTRTTNDTTQVQQMLIMMLTMVITAPMMAIGGVFLALSQDTQLAWVLVAVMPVMAVVFGFILRGAIPLSQAMQTKLDRLNLVLGEGLSGVRVIRAFDRGAHQRARFDAANLDLDEHRDRLEPPDGVPDASAHRDAQPHEHRDHLVRQPPHRRGCDAGRRDDRVAAVRDADPFCGVHGHGDVRDAAPRLGVGEADQRGARRRARDRRSGQADQSGAPQLGPGSAGMSSSRT